jgi:hypothetical protein
MNVTTDRYQAAFLRAFRAMAKRYGKTPEELRQYIYSRAPTPKQVEHDKRRRKPVPFWIPGNNGPDDFPPEPKGWIK